MVEAESEEDFVDMEGQTFEGEVVAKRFDSFHEDRYRGKEWIKHLAEGGSLYNARRLVDLQEVVSSRQVWGIDVRTQRGDLQQLDTSMIYIYTNNDMEKRIERKEKWRDTETKKEAELTICRTDISNAVPTLLAGVTDDHEARAKDQARTLSGQKYRG